MGLGMQAIVLDRMLRRPIWLTTAAYSGCIVEWSPGHCLQSPISISRMKPAECICAHSDSEVCGRFDGPRRIHSAVPAESVDQYRATAFERHRGLFNRRRLLLVLSRRHAEQRDLPMHRARAQIERPEPMLPSKVTGGERRTLNARDLRPEEVFPDKIWSHDEVIGVVH